MHDSTTRDPTFTDHEEERQRQLYDAYRHHADVGEGTAAEVISISSDDSVICPYNGSPFCSRAVSTTRGDENDAAEPEPNYPDFDVSVKQPALTAITLGGTPEEWGETCKFFAYSPALGEKAWERCTVRNGPCAAAGCTGPGTSQCDLRAGPDRLHQCAGHRAWEPAALQAV